MAIFLGLPPDKSALINSILQNTLRTELHYWRQKAGAVLRGKDGHSIDIISRTIMVTETTWFAIVFSYIGQILALTEK